MKEKRLENRVALVTGSGRGIGRGCALALAEEGANICVNYLNDRKEAEETVAKIEELGVEALLVQADMGILSDVDNLVTRTISRFGRLDILVSNVAYEVHMGILDADIEEVRKTIEVTLLGAFRVAQLASQHMVESGGGGKIIFISSIHAEAPFKNAIAYNMCKAGINHLARSMANELAEYRINVNVVAPGWIDTPGERRWNTDEQLAQLGKQLPWGRMGTPADIGKAVAYFASDDADYVTGSILKVDGGFTAALTLPIEWM
ncbi:MAG: glucose 1-dehydrogenase [Firmicutes bacterium]|nr:glucose 1-dehydrogenase [Bacillota bacterium]